MTLCNILLAIGSIKEKRIFFLPWLVLKMLGIVFFYVIALFFLVTGIISLAKPDGQQGDNALFAGYLSVIVAVFVLVGTGKSLMHLILIALYGSLKK
jgi:hypothetical protein